MSRSAVIGVVAGFALIVAIAGAAVSAETPREAYERAARTFSREGIDGVDRAIAEFESVLTADPSLLEAYVATADAWLLKDQFVKGGGEGAAAAALAVLDRLLARSPDHAAGRFKRAVALLSLGREKEATADLERAMRLDPGYLDPRVLQLQLLLGAGKIEEARRFAADTIAAAPRDPAPPRVFGDLFLAAGQAEDALRLYRTVTTLVTAAPRTRLGMGNALLRLGKPGQAETELRAAVALDPLLVEARFPLSVCLGETGKHAEAIEQLELFLKAVPGDVGALNNLALLLEQTGQSRRAKLAWLKVKEAGGGAGVYRDRAEQHLLRLMEAGEAQTPAAKGDQQK